MAELKTKVKKDLESQIKEDRDRKINDYVLDPKEFQMNKSLLKNLGGEMHRPEEQLKLLK